MDDSDWMRTAIEEAERARGKTGDNPWVGCVIVCEERIVGRGHTEGPGEDHAEVGAIREAHAAGAVLRVASLYSTLEPCSFHGRTPACARMIADQGVGRVVFGMRDPNPRVDGLGGQILAAAGIVVVEGVLEAEIRRQLGSWVLAHHEHEAIRRACSLYLPTRDVEATVGAIRDAYAIDETRARALVERAVLLV